MTFVLATICHLTLFFTHFYNIDVTKSFPISIETFPLFQELLPNQSCKKNWMVQFQISYAIQHNATFMKVLGHLELF